MKTRAQALQDLAAVVREVDARVRTMTAREAAESAWRLDHPMTLDELTAYLEGLGICRQESDPGTSG